MRRKFGQPQNKLRPMLSDVDELTDACTKWGAVMFQNRIREYDMVWGDQHQGPTNRPVPVPIHVALLRSVQATAPRPMQISVADIYQAATNRAIQDHELDKLFNPDFYDYHI
jgi:hypothetical protein